MTLTCFAYSGFPWLPSAFALFMGLLLSQCVLELLYYSLLTHHGLYSPLMKRILIVLSIGVVMSSFTLAQTVKRIVILPFDASSSIDAYGLGLATSLQRSLNAINNVYVPPIGDTFQVTQRLLASKQLVVDNVAAAFESSVIVAGDIQADDNGTTGSVLLGFSGPDYPESKQIEITVALDAPAMLVQQVTDVVVRELALSPSPDDLREVAAINAQVPSAPSLNAVSESALRLSPTGLTGLEAAMQLDVNSSWVNAEYARELATAKDFGRAQEISLNAISLQPLDIEALVTRGIILRAAGDDSTALQAFDAALAINPSHAVALAGKGAIQGDAASLESALTVYPRQVDAYLELAVIQNQSDPTKALQTLRKGAKAVPESTALNRAFMQQAISLGDVAGAVSYLQGVTAQANSPASVYSLVTLLPIENQEQALAMIREGRTKYPDNPNLAIIEADLLSRAKDFAGAETILQDTLAQNPGNADVTNALAIAQSAQGKIDEAKATFNSVNTDPDAQRNLARLLIRVGQNQAALETLTPLVQANPNDAELQALYGLSLRGMGKTAEATAAFDAALAINPNNQLAQNAKQLLTEQQSITGGEVTPLNADAQTTFEQGQGQLASGDTEGALASFQQARSLQDNGLSAFYEGYALQQLDRIREAVPAYTRALQDYPESDIILNNLGYAYLQLGRLDLADETLNKALAINANNVNANLNLGLTYYRRGRWAEAVKTFEAVLALEPNQPELVQKVIADAKAKAGQ
jgi:tetratricopeptide (TPR) repeat protein